MSRARAGIRNADFTVSAAWLDYDRDGLADLFIGNYVHWSPRRRSARARKTACAATAGPNAYKPRRAEALSEPAAAGGSTTSPRAPGSIDADRQGDGCRGARLQRRTAGRTCSSAATACRRSSIATTAAAVSSTRAWRAGVALSENGAARANMGVDAADYDRSGTAAPARRQLPQRDAGPLPQPRRRGCSSTWRRARTVGRASLLSVTWAVFFLDYDLDGFLDIFAANGGTDESQGMDSRARLSQPPLVLQKSGQRNLREHHEDASAPPSTGRSWDAARRMPISTATATSISSLATLAGPAYLFRNDGGNQHNWLRVRVTGSRSNRSGLGDRRACDAARRAPRRRWCAAGRATRRKASSR